MSASLVRSFFVFVLLLFHLFDGGLFHKELIICLFILFVIIAPLNVITTGGNKRLD